MPPLQQLYTYGDTRNLITWLGNRAWYTLKSRAPGAWNPGLEPRQRRGLPRDQQQGKTRASEAKKRRKQQGGLDGDGVDVEEGGRGRRRVSLERKEALGLGSWLVRAGSVALQTVRSISGVSALGGVFGGEENNDGGGGGGGSNVGGEQEGGDAGDMGGEGGEDGRGAASKAAREAVVHGNEAAATIEQRLERAANAVAPAPLQSPVSAVLSTVRAAHSEIEPIIEEPERAVSSGSSVSASLSGSSSPSSAIASTSSVSGVGGSGIVSPFAPMAAAAGEIPAGTEATSHALEFDAADKAAAQAAIAGTAATGSPFAAPVGATVSPFAAAPATAAGSPFAAPVGAAVSPFAAAAAFNSAASMAAAAAPIARPGVSPSLALDLKLLSQAVADTELETARSLAMKPAMSAPHSLMNLAAVGQGEHGSAAAAGEDEGVLAAAGEKLQESTEKLTEGVKHFARRMRDKVHRQVHGDADSSTSSSSRGGPQTLGGHGDIAAGGLSEMPSTGSASSLGSLNSSSKAPSVAGSVASSQTRSSASGSRLKRDVPMDMSAVEERHIISLNVRRLSLPSPTHLTPNVAMMAGATHLPTLDESPSASLTVSDVEEG